MSTTNENKEQSGQNPSEILEDYIQDFIKNPITTGVTGLAAGYLLGTYKASKDIEAIKEEHKLQMAERDNQFNQMIRQLKLTHKLIASQTHKTLPSNKEEEDDDENTLHFIEDRKTKVFNYQAKRKKHFELRG
jgi:hypothetical protein